MFCDDAFPFPASLTQKLEHMTTTEKKTQKGVAGGLTAGPKKKKKKGEMEQKACMHVWMSVSESSRRGSMALVVVD